VRPHRLLFFLLAIAIAVPAVVDAAATISIVNMDGPGEGFNDPTPVFPVGGNTGTTLGQQRLIAFQHAANLWGASIDSDVEIKVQAFFNPLTCTATGAVLGAAGAIQIFAEFPNAELAQTWYHVALANKLAGVDLAPGDPGTVADDIQALFNSNLNGSPACLGGRKWYLGLDNNHGTDIDLVVVLLHEFGHGLGFANFVNETAGTRPLGLGDVFSQYTFDNTTGKNWNQITEGAELMASAVNFRNVVWTGVNVTRDVPAVLSPGTPLLRVNSPPSIAGTFPVGTASFGPPLSSPGVTGNVVSALDAADAAGPTTLDGCSEIQNASEVAGNIALVDRGTCGFAVKVRNCQDAGAIAVIVANVAPGSPPGMGNTVPPTVIDIPSVSIMLEHAAALRGAIGPVNATVGLDLSVLAGADAGGRAHLNAPNPVVQGSSISHWDPIAFRNQLMEPAINADLTHSLEPPEDLTLSQMTDIGWFSDRDGVPDGVDQCIGSEQTPTVIIDGCETGAPNQVFTDGCRISDSVAQCAAGAPNHLHFVACATKLAVKLRLQHVITTRQMINMIACAFRADLP
jgi:hypothetical protein